MYKLGKLNHKIRLRSLHKIDVYRHNTLLEKSKINSNLLLATFEGQETRPFSHKCFFFQLKKADQRIIGEGSRIYAKLLGLTDDHGISV